VLDAFLSLPFGNEAEKSFALEIQQVLFADRRRVGQRAAGHDGRELSADERIVIADATGAPREMDARSDVYAAWWTAECP